MKKLLIIAAFIAGSTTAHAELAPGCFPNVDAFDRFAEEGIVFRGVGTNSVDGRVTALLRNSDGSMWLIVNQGPNDFCVLSFGRNWTEYDAEHNPVELPK